MPIWPFGSAYSLKASRFVLGNLFVCLFRFLNARKMIFEVR